MEIKSEPAYDEELVTDIDWAMPDGDHGHTIHPSKGDTFKEGNTDFVINLVSTDPPRHIRVNRAFVYWVEIRQRLFRTRKKGAPGGSDDSRPGDAVEGGIRAQDTPEPTVTSTVTRFRT